jgi:hypothetical protein
MKRASLLFMCPLILAASPCSAQASTPSQPEQRSLAYSNSQQATAQTIPAYAPGANLSFGTEPSNMTVSTKPSILHVGIEPSTLHVGIEPSTLHVGIEPATLHIGIEPSTLGIGIEPSSLHMGIEPSFPPYLGMMPPFAAAGHKRDT